MDVFACTLIDSLGGTVKVAKLMEASTSTVQSWKDAGITRSRLAHLKLIAERDGIAIDWETGAPIGGNADATEHEAASIDAATAPSPDSSDENIPSMESAA